MRIRRAPLSAVPRWADARTWDKRYYASKKDCSDFTGVVCKVFQTLSIFFNLYQYGELRRHCLALIRQAMALFIYQKATKPYMTSEYFKFYGTMNKGIILISSSIQLDSTNIDAATSVRNILPYFTSIIT